MVQYPKTRVLRFYNRWGLNGATNNSAYVPQEIHFPGKHIYVLNGKLPYNLLGDADTPGSSFGISFQRSQGDPRQAEVVPLFGTDHIYVEEGFEKFYTYWRNAGWQIIVSAGSWIFDDYDRFGTPLTLLVSDYAHDWVNPIYETQFKASVRATIPVAASSTCALAYWVPCYARRLLVNVQVDGLKNTLKVKLAANIGYTHYTAILPRHELIIPADFSTPYFYNETFDVGETRLLEGILVTLEGGDLTETGTGSVVVTVIME